MKTDGTPKTMQEAIGNGICEWDQKTGHARESIERHVLDFLRQKFGVAYLALANDPEGLAIVQLLAQDLGVE